MEPEWLPASGGRMHAIYAGMRAALCGKSRRELASHPSEIPGVTKFCKACDIAVSNTPSEPAPDYVLHPRIDRHLQVDANRRGMLCLMAARTVQLAVRTDDETCDAVYRKLMDAQTRARRPHGISPYHDGVPEDINNKALLYVVRQARFLMGEGASL